MAKRVADLLVDVLLEADVQRIYGVPGDSLNGITDSLRTRENIHGLACAMSKQPRSPPAQRFCNHP
jgi:thiamine pyrophosphate-dependent acetolactate synthase large subunit-like protein